MKNKLFTTVFTVLFSITAWTQTNTPIEQSNLHDSQKLYLICHAYIFGTEYTAFKGEIQSELSKMNITFATASANPEWIIYITAFAREYSKSESEEVSNFYAYVDVDLIIEKVTTGERIYQGRISEKGGHTRDYEYAAKIAYSKLTSRISAIIEKYIQNR